MVERLLEKVLEHNNWANQRLIQTCAALEDAQLDAQPQSATAGTIREALFHLVAAQRGYLSLLTMPVEARAHAPLAFGKLLKSAAASGGGLLDIARKTDGMLQQRRLRTTDGYDVEAWVVMVQAIQHAAEHREQVCSMLTALGITPPELDGWAYGEAAGALVER
jgi:uncharacterized damage-inducible protein DinB